MDSDGTQDWELYDITSISDEARAAWDTLNARSAGNNPALDFRFVDQLVRSFGDGSECVALCRSGAEYVAGAVLRPKAFMQWELFVPSQACLSPLVMAHDVDVPGIMSALIRKLPGTCAALRCQRVDPACQPYDQLVSAKIADAVLYGTTFAINLETSFDDYWQIRSKKVRYNMRKVLRSVESAGIKASLTINTDVESMSTAIRLHGELESKGWKGTEGTAINEDNVQGHFYGNLLDEYARTDDALAAKLCFDDQPVASLICIGLKTNLIVLKTAYDEEYSQFGPGRLIDYLLLQELCGASKYKEMEMYTRASRADLSWATDSREWYDMDICRNRLIYEGLKGAKRFKSLARGPFAEGTPNE